MQPYLLLPIGVVVLTLYFYSWFAVKMGMFAASTHWRLWNVVLLATFFGTAIPGLLLAVRINFGFEWPWCDAWLKYHVDFGIAMLLVSVFHLCRHLPYYFPFLISANVKSIKVKAVYELDRRRIEILLLVLGAGTVIVQVVILRLFLSIYYGNETVIALFLSVWMMLTGAGAWLGGKSVPGLRRVAVLWLSYSFFALLVGAIMGYVKALFVPVGVLVGTWQLLLIVVVMLMPVCVCSGYVFRCMTTSVEGQGARFYALETAGSVVGGVFVTFSVLLLEPLITLALVLLMNMVAMSFVFVRAGRVRYLLWGVAVAVSLVFAVTGIDEVAKAPLFRHQQIVEAHDTPYGGLTVTTFNGEINVYSDLFRHGSPADVENNEETVHFAALQHGSPRKVLLVSTAYSGILPEILKYPSLRQLVYIEPNPWVLKYTSKYFPLPDDGRLSVVRQDPKRFLRRDTVRYDVVLMDVAEPGTLQQNRYYTLEFFELLKAHSTPSTVVSYGLATSGNYLGEENVRLYSMLYNTLRRVYRYVAIVPGNRNYFLASDSPLTLDYGKLLATAAIQTRYVGPYYLDERSLTDRSRLLHGAIDARAPVNTDTDPSALWAHTTGFFKLFKVDAKILLGAVILLLILPVLRLNRVSQAVYVSGLTASSLEMLILYSFQVAFGYLYAASGMLFAVFMAGLSLGAGRPGKAVACHLYTCQLLMALAVVGVGLFLFAVPHLGSFLLLYPLMGVLTFIPAYFTGRQYSLAMEKMPSVKGNKSGYLYGVDLLGSALGLLVVTTVLVPVWGCAFSVTVLVIVNVLSGLFLWFFKT